MKKWTKIESKLARFIVKPIFYHFLANVGKKSHFHIYKHITLAIDNAIVASENNNFLTDFAFFTQALPTNGPTDRPTDQPMDGHTLL